MFKYEISGIRDLKDAFKATERDFNRGVPEVVIPALKEYLVKMISKEVSDHTLEISTISTSFSKGSYVVRAKYRDPEDVDESDRLEEERERLERRLKDLEKKMKEVSKLIAERYKNASKSRSDIKKLQDKYSKLKNKNVYSKSLLSSLNSRLKDLSKKADKVKVGLEEKRVRLIEIQQEIRVVETRIVENKAIPIKSKYGDIVTRKLSHNTILTNKNIPPHVRGQYLFNYYVNKFFDEEFRKIAVKRMTETFINA